MLPKALLFQLGEFPVFVEWLRLCREHAVSGHGEYSSVADYLTWWFIFSPQRDTELALPEDPNEDDAFVPGLVEGMAQLLTTAEGIGDILKRRKDEMPYNVSTHAVLGVEELTEILREQGFEAVRAEYLLSRNRAEDCWQNDAAGYEDAEAEAFAMGSPSEHEQLAFDYILGRRRAIPASLSLSTSFFDELPPLPHPSLWIEPDRRCVDVARAARVFEHVAVGTGTATFDTATAAWADLGLDALLSLVAQEDVTLPASIALLLAQEELGHAHDDASPRDRRRFERKMLQATIEVLEVCDEIALSHASADDLDDLRAQLAALDRQRTEVEEAPGTSPERARLVADALSDGSFALTSAWGDGAGLQLVVGEATLEESCGMVLRSENGEAWTAAPLPCGAVAQVRGACLVDGRRLIVAVGEEGAAYSWDDGSTWERSRGTGPFRAVAIAPDGCICAVGNGQRVIAESPDELSDARGCDPCYEDVLWDGGRFVAVQLEGAVDTHENGAWSALAEEVCRLPRALASLGSTLVVAGEGEVALSEDRGESWTRERVGLQAPQHAASFAPDGLLVAGETGAAQRGDEGWSALPITDTSGVVDAVRAGSTLLVTSRGSLSRHRDGRVETLRFRHAGAARAPALERADFGLAAVRWPSAHDARCLVGVDERLFVGTPAGLHVSHDAGASWERLSERSVSSLVAWRGELWAANDGASRSRDGGRTWDKLPGPRVTHLVATVHGLLGVRGARLFRRGSGEDAWEEMKRFQFPIQDIGVTDDGRAWLVSHGLYVSDPTQSTWAEEVAGLVFSATLAAGRLVALTPDALHVGVGEAFVRHPITDADAFGLRAVRSLPRGGLLLASERDLYWTADHGRQLRCVNAPLSTDVRPAAVLAASNGRELVLSGERVHAVVPADHAPCARWVDVVTA